MNSFTLQWPPTAAMLIPSNLSTNSTFPDSHVTILFPLSAGPLTVRTSPIPGNTGRKQLILNREQYRRSPFHIARYLQTVTETDGHMRPLVYLRRTAMQA
jgi:hypothetical protein